MGGSFVVLEGMDGSGTTTQTRLLIAFLRKQGFRVFQTQEPQNRAIGKIVREMIKTDKFSPETIALAFAADRMEHVDSVIKPALENYDFVISDRYYHSSLTYQPLMGLDYEWVRQLSRFAITPDITFIIDVPVEVFMKRRGKTDVIYENASFQGRLRRVYKSLPEKLNEDIIILDGTRTKSGIHKEIREIVVKLR